MGSVLRPARRRRPARASGKILVPLDRKASASLVGPRPRGSIPSESRSPEPWQRLQSKGKHLTRHGASSRPQALQRKISTKDGNYADSTSLPKVDGYNPALESAADDSQTWLVASDKDIHAIASSQGAQLVSPHIHVIAENHTKSKWSEIEKKWGYSKKITYEDLADSPTVRSSETAYQLQTNPNRLQENVMENLHAKIITDLAGALHISKRLKAIYGNWKIYLDEKNNTEAGKMEEMGRSARSDIAKYLDVDTLKFYWNRDYVNAAKLIGKKSSGVRTGAEKLLLQLMNGPGKDLPDKLARISENPIGTFTFKDTTKAKELETAKTNLTQIADDVKDVIDLLHDIIEAEFPGEQDDAMQEQKIRIGGITANSSNVLATASPLREHFMVKTMLAMGGPSIAVMGIAHKISIAKDDPMSDAKYYDKYDDFVAKTTSKI